MNLIVLFLQIFEIVGIIAFSISGVMIAFDKKMDLLGAAVLGVMTAVGGGVIRDILLGIHPPSILMDHFYLFIALLTSCVLLFYAKIFKDHLKKHREKFLGIVNVVDAIGLGIFTVIGVNTAINLGYGSNWVLSIFIGVITGVGGGVLRDVLAREIPMVLHKRIYAVAALVGAIVRYLFYIFALDPTLGMVMSAGIVMIIRLLATTYKWKLPSVSL